MDVYIVQIYKYSCVVDVMYVDIFWFNVYLIIFDGEGLGVICDGVLVCVDGCIIYVGWVGSDVYLQLIICIDGEGCWILFGLIDCYIYLVYVGNCVNEFEQCLQGVSYVEIV